MAMLCLDGIVTVNPACLRDVGFLKETLLALVARVGMKPVGEVIIQPYAHWEGTAPSAILFLEESSITVHCYPEKDYLEITIHTCNAIDNPTKVAVELRESLGLEVRYSSYAPARNWRERAERPWRPGDWPAELRTPLEVAPKL